MKQTGPAIARREIVGLGFAAALVPLNSTMIAVALPDVADDFGVASGRTGLLVTAYLVVMLVGQPLAGRLSDSVGVAQQLRWALLGFVLVSCAAVFAPSFGLLTAARAAQAVFGAALVPCVQSALRAGVSATSRGRAFGVQTAFIGGGAATGPIVGGAATELAGWEGVFVINIPVVVIALVMLRGFALAPPARSGLGPPAASVLRNPVFVAAFVSNAAFTLGQYSLLLATPIVLTERGWSASQVGLALIALTVGLIVTGPVGGQLGDRRGRRGPVVGTAIAAAVAVAAAAAGVEQSAVALIVAMGVFGITGGLAMPNVLAAGLGSVPARAAGTAAGIMSMSRYVGSITSSVLLAVLVSDGGAGASTMLVASAAGTAVAIPAAMKLPAREIDDPGLDDRQESGRGHAIEIPDPSPRTSSTDSAISDAG